MIQNSGSSAEFSRFVRLVDTDKDDITVSLNARPAEREALAKRLAIAGIESLQASLLLSQVATGVYHLSGNIEAEIRVAVEGEDRKFDFSVTEPVEEVFATSSGWAALAAASPDEDVDAEFIEGLVLDLGEVASQCLSLALDPLLLEAAALEEGAIVYSESPDEDPEIQGPFAALATLKKLENGGSED